MVGSFSDRSRIVLGSWSDRSRIGNDVSPVFSQLNVGWSFCVAGAGWRLMPVAPRIVNDVAYVMRINHEIHVAWQAQYLVRLEGDACCSAHCK